MDVSAKLCNTIQYKYTPGGNAKASYNTGLELTGLFLVDVEDSCSDFALLFCFVKARESP